MEDNTDWQAKLDQLAIIACEVSGIDAFYIKDGRAMYRHDEAQERARIALATLRGQGREEMI